MKHSFLFFPLLASYVTSCSLQIVEYYFLFGAIFVSFPDVFISEITTFIWIISHKKEQWILNYTPAKLWKKSASSSPENTVNMKMFKYKVYILQCSFISYKAH